MTPFNGGDKPYQGSLTGACLSKHCCLCGHTSLIVFYLNPGFKSKPNLPAALLGGCFPVSCRELCWFPGFGVTAAQFNPSYLVPVESVLEAVMAVVAAPQKNLPCLFP